MPLPEYVRRSYGGGAQNAQLTQQIGSGDTKFTISPTTGWVEEDGSALGTIGPFTVAIDRFTPSVEKILCSSINLTTGIVSVFVDPSDGTVGRGYDGTAPQAHVPGGSVSGVQNVWSSVEADEANQAVVDVLGAGGIGSLGVPIGGIIAYGSSFNIPANFVKATGQLLARSSFSALFNAITVSGTASTIASNPNVTGVSFNCDYFAPGMAVTLVNSGGAVYNIASIGSTSAITLNTGSGITHGINGGIIIYPWGAGDGSTTFQLPDTQGRFLAGESFLNTPSQGNLAVGSVGQTEQVTTPGRTDLGISWIIRVQ